MSSQSWSWVERHKAEGLAGGCLDNLPDIEFKFIRDDGDFVDQADVDRSEGILEKVTISAAVGLETEMTWSTIEPYRVAAASLQLSDTPPMILRVFFTVNCSFPGSIRSGLKAR